MAEETWKGVIFMTPIEFTEREIERVKYRLWSAKKRPNAPQSELNNLEERLRMETEILDILKKHFNE